MSILPWISYVKKPYIKISNLRIDGQLKALKKEWDEKSLHNQSVDTTIADFEIFPPSEYGISNYEEIEFDLYFGITDARYENNFDVTVEDFYDEELKNLGVYAIIHGYETKFRVSQKMKVVKEGSPLDESSLYWKTHIKLSKDYFGDAIYISPYIESSLGSIFEDKKTIRGIFGGGEINKNTNFIKINFTSKEPPTSAKQYL